MVAAELQVLVESLAEDSDTRGRVNLILAKMARAAGGGGPQRFDIGEADGGICGDGMAGRRSGEGPGGGAALWVEDCGRWNRRGEAAARRAVNDASDDGWQVPRRTFRPTGSRFQAQRGGPAGADTSECGAVPGGNAPPPLGNESEVVGGSVGGVEAHGPHPVEGGPTSAAGGKPANAEGGSANDGTRTGKPRRRLEGEEADPPSKSHRGEDEVLEASVELGG